MNVGVEDGVVLKLIVEGATIDSVVSPELLEDSPVLGYWVRMLWRTLKDAAPPRHA